MPIVALESEKGFSLLELSLAVAISMGFLIAFFGGYRTYLQAIQLASDNVHTQSEAAQLMGDLVDDINQATSGLSTPTGKQLQFSVGATLHEYQLVDPISPAIYSHLQKRLGGVGSFADIGPTNLITNNHPFNAALKSWSGPDSPAHNAVNFFAIQAAGSGHVDYVQIYMVAQARSDAPPRYVMGVATPRALRSAP